MALSDDTLCHLPRPSVEDGVVSKNITLSGGSPLKQLPTLLHGHINLSPTTSELERSYALGWIRTMLPGPLGTVGLNPVYVDAMPLVGKGLEEPTVVIHHQGSLIDFLSSII